MEIKRQVVMRTIGDETMLIPVGKTLNKYNGIFTLTPTAASAFDAIQNGADRDKIVDLIANEYDADIEVIKNDVDEFLSVLKEYGII